MKKIIKKTAVCMAALCSIVMMNACNKTKDAAIRTYTRDTTSGTRDGFFTGIGFSSAKEDNSVLADGYVEVASNGDMVNAVKNDEYGIGYISLSSLDDSGLKGLVYEGVEPTEENVLNKTYKLTRNFNYCKRSEYSNSDVEEIVNAFIAFSNTVEGKATIAEHGGILTTSATDKSWNEVKNDFLVDDKDNSNITVNIGGSTSVRSIVSNLLTEFVSKCGNFKYNYNPTGSSDAYKRTNGSEKDGANACDLAFASREFNDNEPMADSLKGTMCIDAIVAVVNNKNSVSTTTAATLKSIYSGEVTKWSEVK